MNNLPKEWKEQKHFEFYIGWFTRLEEQKMSDEAMELEERPGWWTHMRITDLLTITNSEVEALQAIKTYLLKDPLDDGEKLAPVKLTLQQRKDLWERFRQSKSPELVDGKNRYELFEQYGDYALLAEISYLPFCHTFTTQFGMSNNPVRSLNGKQSWLYQDGVLVAEGVVQLEGNQLTVGEFVQEFGARVLVEGAAFDEANWMENDTDYQLEIAKSNQEPETLEEQP